MKNENANAIANANATHGNKRSKNRLVGKMQQMAHLLYIDQKHIASDQTSLIRFYLLMVCVCAVIVAVICLFGVFSVFCERFSFPFHFVFTFPFRCYFASVFLFVLSCFHCKKMNYGVGRHKCKARSLFSSLCLFRLFRHIVSLFQQKLKANIRSQRHIIKGCRDQQKCPFFFEYNFE